MNSKGYSVRALFRLPLRLIYLSWLYVVDFIGLLFTRMPLVVSYKNHTGTPGTFHGRGDETE